MSKLLDPLTVHGGGFLPLQHLGHEAEGYEVDGRICVLAARVVDRNDQPGEFGEWVYGDNACGDLTGAFFWAAADRPIGAFQFGKPALIVDSGGGRTFERSAGGGLRAKGAQQVNPNERPAHKTDKPGAKQPEAIPGSGGKSKEQLKREALEEGKRRAQELLKPFQGSGVNLGENPLAGWVGVGGGWVNPWPNAGALNNVNVLGLQMGPWLNPVFGFGANKNQTVGLNVAPLNIYVAGAAAAADLKAGGDDIYMFFGADTAAPIPQTFVPAGLDWIRDDRFTMLSADHPIGWPDFPRGYAGYVVPASNEDQQQEFFLPVDPRLPCVHVGEPANLAAILTDVTFDGYMDVSRGARIHSLAWVIKAPQQTADPKVSATELKLRASLEAVFGTGPIGQKMLDVYGIGSRTKFALGENTTNSIGWNIGPSGNGDVMGGFMVDSPDRASNETMTAKDREKRVIGHISARHGGPIDVGSTSDIHQWGADADGNRINAAHIQTGAFFRMPGSDKYDGPIDFETAWPKPSELSYPVRVHWGFNGGVWKNWTTVIFKTHTPGDRQPDPEPPPPLTPEPVVTPPAVPGGGPPGPGGVPDPNPRPEQQPDRDANQHRDIGITHLEVGGPGLAFRPVDFTDGEPDFAHQIMPDPVEFGEYERTAPMVARLQAYGQAGAPWTYTNEPGTTFFDGGSANGGLSLSAAETGLEWDSSSMVPAGASLSSVYLTMSPTASLGWGLPDLATGGVNTGYSSRIDSTGNLIFSRHSAAAALTESFRMESDGLHTFNDHGEILTANGSTAQSGLDTTPVVLSGFTANGTFSNTAPDHTSDTITVSRTGTFLVMFQFSGVGSAGVDFHFHPYVNGSVQSGGCHRQFTAANGSCSFQTLLALTSGDVIDIRVATAAGANKTITPVDAQLSIVRVR